MPARRRGWRTGYEVQRTTQRRGETMFASILMLTRFRPLGLFCSPRLMAQTHLTEPLRIDCFLWFVLSPFYSVSRHTAAQADRRIYPMSDSL